MFYVIQENVFKEHHFELLLEMMRKSKLEFQIVKYVPFVSDIVEWYDSEKVSEDYQYKVFNTDKEKVFCFGAGNMADAARRNGWKPGSMMNENHDFNVYAPKFGMENMLNGDGVIIDFTDPIPFSNSHFFARPTNDSKIFAGQIFSQDDWNTYVKNCIKTDTVDIMKETKFLVSPVKDIQQEVRCWVVGGKVVTASRYKIGNRVVYANYDDETFFTDFAQKMVDKFQVADAFVIDVCLANDELKVVEVNNINSAGFYHCNMEKLITALENHFDKQ